MNRINSKELIIIIIGLVISIIITLFSTFADKINLFSFGTIYFILIIALLIILALIWAFHRENNEIKEELEKQELEQKKLVEKLKIHEQLIDMKAEVKELQKQVFKK